MVPLFEFFGFHFQEVTGYPTVLNVLTPRAGTGLFGYFPPFFALPENTLEIPQSLFALPKKSPERISNAPGNF